MRGGCAPRSCCRCCTGAWRCRPQIAPRQSSCTTSCCTWVQREPAWPTQHGRTAQRTYTVTLAPLPREQHHPGRAHLAPAMSGTPEPAQLQTRPVHPLQGLWVRPQMRQPRQFQVTRPGRTSSAFCAAARPTQQSLGPVRPLRSRDRRSRIRIAKQSPGRGPLAAGASRVVTPPSPSSLRRVTIRRPPAGSHRNCTACSEPSARLATAGHPGQVLLPPAPQ
mmetsp:Transcript_7579/g.22381  ORF Transcript_7579/g.22381 Transcript_7579/m.22381 type:complete len:221 (-) Transcript_7579:1046-1708(-)